MNNSKNHIEWDSLEDDQQIKDLLQNYTVEYPDEQQIERTIDRLRRYVPQKRKHQFIQHCSLITRMIFRELSGFSPLFWCLNLALLFGGCTLILSGRTNVYLTVMAMAPVPLILGLVELYKNWQHGMRELEMTTKYSLQQIVLSRMLAVGLFNLGSNLFVTVLIPLAAVSVLTSRLLFFWMTPFAVFSALSLFIAMHIRSGYAAVIIPCAVWSGVLGLLSISSPFRQWLTRLQQGYLLLTVVLSAMWFVYQIYQMNQSSRSIKVEIND